MTVAVLLGLAVAAAWLGAAAFVRLATPLARLHVVAFVNAAGLLVVAAVAVADGLSGRTFKAAFTWVVTMAAGALLSHVTARALHLRDGAK